MATTSQQILLPGSHLIQPGSDCNLGLLAHERADGLRVTQKVHGRQFLHVERLCQARVGIYIYLGQCDSASPLVDKARQNWPQGTPRPARRTIVPAPLALERSGRALQWKSSRL